MQSLADEYLTYNATSHPWNVTTTTTTILWYDNDTYYHNGTNYTDLEPRNQFVLPWWRQMIWTLLFAGMIAVATGGNLIVIWIVMAHRRMRTVTNYFLVNLSIADAMVSTLNVTFNYTYMLNSHWPFGTLYCKICQFIAVLTICASVFTLMAISIDRWWRGWNRNDREVACEEFANIRTRRYGQRTRNPSETKNDGGNSSTRILGRA